MDKKLAQRFGLTRVDAIVCAATTEEDAVMNIRTFLASDQSELKEWMDEQRRAGHKTFATSAVELISNNEKLFAQIKIADGAVAKFEAERKKDRRRLLIVGLVKAVIDGLACGTAAWVIMHILQAIPTN